MKKYLLFILIILFFISCAKEVNFEMDIKKPKIEVVYPIDNPVMRSGDPLCIKVLISDNKSLANVWVTINDGQGFKKEYSIPGRSIEIIEKYIVPQNLHGNFTASYFAIDDAGNSTSEEINFTVNN